MEGGGCYAGGGGDGGGLSVGFGSAGGAAHFLGMVVRDGKAEGTWMSTCCCKEPRTSEDALHMGSLRYSRCCRDAGLAIGNLSAVVQYRKSSAARLLSNDAISTLAPTLPTPLPTPRF